jgi:antitoxin component of RelBE/YafQ-DinJ toxin-antitoxin module
MATEPLPQRIQQPTTIRFSDDLRQAGESIAQRNGISFADVVRMALAAMIRHEDSVRQED